MKKAWKMQLWRDPVKEKGQSTGNKQLSIFGTFSYSAKRAKSRPTLVDKKAQFKKLPNTFYPNKKGMIRPKNHLTLLSLLADALWKKLTDKFDTLDGCRRLNYSGVEYFVYCPSLFLLLEWCGDRIFPIFDPLVEQNTRTCRLFPMV